MNAHVLHAPAATDETLASIRHVLDRRGQAWAAFFKLIGPAVVVSVAYVDPGNIATNVQAGARYGYTLLWVALLASFIAMFFQALSAKLGIVTGRNLAELCRDHLPYPLVVAIWLVSELAAMATDLAELIGGALGVSLLLHLPLLAGMVVTALATCALLALESRGFRPLERLVGVLVGVIALSYLAELFVADVHWKGVAAGLINDRLPDAQALNLAVGMMGATVMPHALFLHSGLTQSRVPPRSDREKRRLLTYSHVEVIFALTIAALINLAMIVMAASAFHQGRHPVDTLEEAYRMLTPRLGACAAGLFLVALMASGISSSVVGTMAGQMIAQGFVRVRLPIGVRRAVTLLPSLMVVGLGLDATRALIDSQIVLSLALPVPMIALVWFTGQRKVMGEYRNRPVIHALAVSATVAVAMFNLLLVAQSFGFTVLTD